MNSPAEGAARSHGVEHGPDDTGPHYLSKTVGALWTSEQDPLLTQPLFKQLAGPPRTHTRPPHTTGAAVPPELVPSLFKCTM